MNKPNDVLVRVENAAKKYCRSLKRSLWYGVRDITGDLMGRANGARRLRPGEFWAINNISFELRRGECLGLIGPNGAGKSTLLKMLNGLIKPDAGRIEFRGRVGALIELGAGFHPILSGRENIYVNGAILGLTKREIDGVLQQIIEFAEIGDAIDAPVCTYSTGMRVRLGFAIAAHLKPDVLLIDEVLAVGDASFRARCYDTIGNTLRNTAVVFVSHGMGHVNRLCDRVLVVAGGEGALYENPAEGIDHYMRLTTKSALGQGMRHESGATLSNLAVQGPEGISKGALGKPLEISFDLQIDPEYDGAVVYLTVLSGESLPVAYASNFNSPLVNTGESQHVRFQIDQLPLSHGLYSLAVIIQDRSLRQQLLWYQGVARFEVQGDRIYRAGITLLGNWTIHNAHRVVAPRETQHVLR